MPGKPEQTLLPTYPRAMGMVLEEASSDLVVGALDVAEAHGNRNGVMHGSAIMTFADALGGVAAAVNLTGDDRTTTLESKTNSALCIKRTKRRERPPKRQEEP